MTQTHHPSPVRHSALLLLCLLLLPVPAYSASAPAPELQRLISSGGVAARAHGAPLVEYRADRLFVPASTIKLVTALAALETLGPTYRFRTEFFLQGEATLVIRGHGDPFLTSESIAAAAAALKTSGIRKITGLVLDDSRFELDQAADGSGDSENPYDAPNSALAVNFNTLPLWKSESGIIASGEPQTPLLPMMQRIGAGLPPGPHRVNVAAFPQYGNLSNTLRYSAELFAALLRAAGIEVGDLARRGLPERGATLVYTHSGSKTVRELVRDCLTYSNNFIANQLYLACAIARWGAPATWERAQAALLGVLSGSLLLDISAVTIVEGSGLSRRNRLTPAFLLSVLERFTPYADLLQRKNHDILIKSGTLRGVYCYAGYFASPAALEPFVIMLNQPVNNRDPILRLLHRHYLAAHSPADQGM